MKSRQGDPTRQGAHIHPRYINRELSWLDFNDRVLSLALSPQLPLLERVKFLAISATNLDEFYQVRVAALHDQIAAEVSKLSLDGRTPLQQLHEIAARVQKFVAQQEHLLTHDILPALATNGIRVMRWNKLGKKAREALTTEFMNRMFPILTPLSVDPSHPFPYISSLALNLAVTVRDADTGDARFARVKVPRNFPRFIAVPGSEDFILLDDLIEAHLDRLFAGMEIVSVSRFRVSRNADLSVDDEDADDLLAAVEMELRRRRFGRAVRLEVQSNISKVDLAMMCAELELEPVDVIRHDHFIEFSALMQLAGMDKPHLRFKPWTPVTAGRVAGAEEAGKSMFDVIRSRQLLVHHPYESFVSSTETFVEQAANDPKVLSIKMTLYRTSGDSAIARHLIRAAEAGKQVAVVLELKARFDEARNVSWARELELAGVHVNYGLAGLKTHAKCILVVREEAGEIRRYVHLATGNYNSVTARTYEDIGFFTCEEAVGRDATQLFNYLTGYGREPDYEQLLVAPHQLKPEIIRLINNEATFGAEGRITLKLNAVQDPEVIEALYEASAAGTKIDMVVRGICCVRAGVPGVSDNITVRSVLGRYLEHSRIYRFAHGYQGNEPLHLTGSADLMIRNLSGRVETLVRLTHPKHRAWLDTALGFLLDDANVHYRLDADNRWSQVGEHHTPHDAQRQLFEWVVATQSR